MGGDHPNPSLSHGLTQFVQSLGWAKTCIVNRRVLESVAPIQITSICWRPHLPEAQELVLIDPALVSLRFESRDWRSFVQHSVSVEMQNGLRELTALAER